MNSEELELSLRNEFESNLRDTLAEIRQEINQFREKFEAEFEKHKLQLDEVFQEFSAKINAEKSLDAGFTETVVEHLRLARDEGSRVAVAAMEKAEALQAEAEPEKPKAGISELSVAINDISSKTTQSSILRTLVHHAAQFTPRGAFFIIKNEHLVGWRVFGREGNADEHTVREVFFPVASETVLGEAVRSLSSIESSYGNYADDSIYLNKLEFGHPDRMYAMPLIVRGRSVAVLYADNGNDGEEVNVEALETLARVASLTVEVLASFRNVKTSSETEHHQEVEESGALDSSYVNFANQQESSETEVEPQTEFAETESEPQPEVISEDQEESTEAGFVMIHPEPQEEISQDEPAEIEETVETVSEDSEPASYQMVESSEESAVEEVSQEFSTTDVEEVSEVELQPEVEAVEETAAVEEPVEESSYYEPVAETPVLADEYSTSPVNEYESVNDYKPENDYQFESNQSFEPTPKPETSPFEPAQVETTQFETTQFEFTAPQPIEEPVTPQNDFNNFETQPIKEEVPIIEPAPVVSEPVASKPPVRARFSERNVDLPIEVSEDERRLHNDARRFARLLVSEIKLYNEQKVKEGRDASDLYERLREAIDRSREMYDKRVQPPVAARFDYFHYEVVSTLAEGDENKLGNSYPGATV